MSELSACQALEFDPRIRHGHLCARDNLFWYIGAKGLSCLETVLGGEGLKTIHTNEYEFLLGRLISARRAAGMTQQDLASRLDKPQSFVSKYERRERRLDLIEFVLICGCLGLNSSKILREVEDRLLADSHPVAKTP